ncbi:SDR family oxidoreductase [Methylocucumis oryzae]|uniref:SDR family oxidoreductase n=1 Tax=Methylocucumis oryzae TaxID=1632867 RepID=UPI000AC1B8FF|nr:SDR family oxidoreductase [Methylocucumis oryzae]
MGVKKIIQLSALGADEHAQSAYHLSKKAADDVLRQLPITHSILQPSIIYGHGAVSTELFSTLAALPIHLLPNNGQSLLQPIHIDDVVACICQCLESNSTESRAYILVGSEPISYRDYLQHLRKRLGKPPAQTYALGDCGYSLLGALLPILGEPILSADNLAMLQQGNFDDPHDTTTLLKRPPQNIKTWLSTPASQAERWYAHMYFYKPALRYCIALVWLWSGITSILFYPHQQSYDLLAQLGIHNTWAVATLYGLASLDLAMGLAVLFCNRLTFILLVQIWIVLGYSIAIAVYLPEFWLHPFGPTLKNLPFLLCLSIYRSLEGEKS